jgi:formamidopyrimidine-DNA glycosylase
MPEILEVESYRALAAPLVGAIVATVIVDPHLAAKSQLRPRFSRQLAGQQICGVSRIGKLLVIELDHMLLGVHFAMTGRLFLDGASAVGPLAYGPAVDEARWVRASFSFADGRTLLIDDSRRFGRLLINPDLTRYGPDALDASSAALRAAVEGAGPDRAIKAILLDQSVIAGLGNLLVDELCWRIGVHPARTLGSLGTKERRDLFRGIGTVLRVLGRRGGSHTGDLMEARHPGGRCPRDGASVEHLVVAGRSTYACVLHQQRQPLTSPVD